MESQADHRVDDLVEPDGFRLSLVFLEAVPQPSHVSVPLHAEPDVFAVSLDAFHCAQLVF